jgi:hypothetical protein
VDSEIERPKQGAPGDNSDAVTQGRSHEQRSQRDPAPLRGESIRQKGYGARKETRFANAHEKAEKQKLRQSARKTTRDRGETPEGKRDQDDCSAVPAICKAAKRDGQEAVHERERRALRQARGDVGQPKIRS